MVVVKFYTGCGLVVFVTCTLLCYVVCFVACDCLLIIGGYVSYLVVFGFWVFVDVRLGCLFADGCCVLLCFECTVYYRLIAIEVVCSVVLLRLVGVAVVLKVCGVVLVLCVVVRLLDSVVCGVYCAICWLLLVRGFVVCLCLGYFVVCVGV